MLILCIQRRQYQQSKLAPQLDVHDWNTQRHLVVQCLSCKLFFLHINSWCFKDMRRSRNFRQGDAWFLKKTFLSSEGVQTCCEKQFDPMSSVPVFQRKHKTACNFPKVSRPLTHSLDPDMNSFLSIDAASGSDLTPYSKQRFTDLNLLLFIINIYTSRKF